MQRGVRGNCPRFPPLIRPCVHSNIKKNIRWYAISKSLRTTALEFQQLSDTRWSCRVSSCKALLNRIGAVVSLLTEIKNQDSGKRAVEATGILCLIDKDFVRMLYFITDILTITKRFSDFLQSENLDLAAASDMSLVVMEELQEKREGGIAFEELERNVVRSGKFRQQKTNDEKSFHSD